MPEQPHSTWNREESQPIAIPLLGAGSRSNVDPDHDDYGFIGRDGLISELLTTLDQTRNSRGCYLIAGFRGSGKTSLINKVLSRHADNSACYPAWVAFPADQSIPDYESVSPYLERGKKKIEEIIDQKSINDSSVPTTTRDPYATSFRKKMLDLLGRSLNYLHSRIRTFHFVRSFSPLIDVRVNLGHEKPLGSRDVLLNTATLLYQKLKRQPIETRVARWGTYLLLAALPTIAVYLFWWEPFLRWLYDWLPWSWMFPDTKKLLSPPWVGGLLTLIFIRYLWIRHLPTYDRILFRMKQLHGKMAYANEYSSVLGKSGISLSRRRNAAPIDEREIEMELLDILEDCRGVFPLFVRPDIIFVFDELDKISPDGADESGESSGMPSVDRDSRERKKKVDQLLGALKNFITHGQARFFFIAGREMLDSYYAERASTSSLYESLFNRTFEVPSLLSDRSNRNHLRIHSMIEAFVCRKLLSRDVAIYLWLLHAHQSRNNDPSWETDLRRKLTYSPFCLRTYYHYLCLVPGMEGKEARRIVLGLRNFVQFLTLHSWGNPKRLILLFEHFTKPMSDVDWRQRKQARHIAGLGSTAPLALQFGVMDQQRIILASNLYTQIYHAMGRQLARSSDKLIVSTFAAFQYILKFHRHPFSRNSLERIAESLDIYRPAELNTLVDALLSKVLRPQVRLIRNSHYRYRFDSSFEEEMRYISRVSDIESAAFNFTLDSAAAIKAFFRLELREMEKQDGTLANKSAVGIAGLCGILGDLLAQEQSDGQALSYYQKAVDVIDQCEPSVRRRIAHIQVEALLRLGELYERRQRYNRAASVYLHARKIVRDLERHSDDYAMLGAMRRGDSKWDIFRQPFWAYWFLQLKRSPMPARDALPLTGFEYPFSPGSGDAVNHYRAGQLAFYYGCHCAAVSSFLLAIGSSNQSTETSERTVHRRAYAYLNLGENLLVGLMRYGNDLRDRDGFSVVVERLDSGDKINKLEELVKKFEDGEAGYINKLRAVRSETADPENRQYLVNNFNGTLTFGMMAHAAKMLSDAGMYYHAALAYMKIIATWG